MESQLPNEIKVKRITAGCCGLYKGQVYNAVWYDKDTILIEKATDDWTDPHLFTGKKAPVVQTIILLELLHTIKKQLLNM